MENINRNDEMAYLTIKRDTDPFLLPLLVLMYGPSLEIQYFIFNGNNKKITIPSSKVIYNNIIYYKRDFHQKIFQ